MARLFLSYSRKDEAKALDKIRPNGSSVKAMTSGATRTTLAEVRVSPRRSSERSRIVTQCWCCGRWISAQSMWVRDEAGYARDAGKLIPVSLDGAEAPLGFRQLQAIALTQPKGYREPANTDRIRRAVERITN